MLNLRADLFRRAVRRLDDGQCAVIGQSDIAFHQWLEKKKAPKELTDFLVENALESELSFNGLGGMWTPELIMQLNDQEASLFEGGLVAVGNAVNGDFIVIDLAHEGTAGYVSHDLLWDKRSGGGARQAYVPVARSIGDMLHGMTAVEDFPIDYYRAKDWRQIYGASSTGIPAGSCLVNTWELLEELVYLTRGRLIDRVKIEAMMEPGGPMETPRWIAGDPRSRGRTNFPSSWNNDMQTVAFDFDQHSFCEASRALLFAKSLSGLNPSEFDAVAIGLRVCIRMHFVGADAGESYSD